MRRACGTWALIYVVLALAVGAIVYRRFPEPQMATGAAFIGGFIAWLGVGYLAGIPRKFAEAAMMRRALDGDPPRDGDRIAAVGRIDATGAALTAPLSGTPCVAYKYEIKTGSGKAEVAHYDGFALTPSAIYGPQGAIRLLAWPELKVPPQVIPAPEAYPNSEEYIGTTEFRVPMLANLRQSFADLMEIYRDDDGSVRSDTRHPQASSNLQSATYREWLVRRGDTVCVTGRFSAARAGIVPAASPLLEPVTLDTADPHLFIRRAYRGAVGYLIGAILFGGGVLAGLIALYAMVPLDAAEQMAPSMRASWMEIRLENLLNAKLRPRTRDGAVAVLLPFDSAAGRVRSPGRDEVVMRSTATRDGDRTTVSIDDTIVFTCDKQSLRSLRILGRDIDPSAADFRLITNTDFEIAGRLTYWSEETACRVTFRAR